MVARLNRIRLAGYRSLRDVSVDLTPVTVLIGPNGSGKSNLLSALRLLPLMRTQSLRRFVGERGGASSLLHYGPSTTREMTLEVDFAEDEKQCAYSARLGYGAGDALVFLDETASYQPAAGQAVQTVSLGAGHLESVLADRARGAGEPAVKIVDAMMSRLGYFHFHDSSPTSPLRQSARQADNRYLRSDGSNLASLLFRLRGSDAAGAVQSWNLINALARRVAPAIKTLSPELVDPDKPEQSAVRLYWADERDHRFDTHDFSDGTLRAIALITALAQPSTTLPRFISIDEPELGLHPAAIGLFASLVRSVSRRCQVLIATQSPALLDEFEPEEVVVTEHRHGETSFKRLVPKDLEAWLEDYSLSELYDKNVLGGRP
jgi:predicted ATPase